MMSFNPQDSSNDLESISPFSSLDSDINSIALNQKLSEEKEKSRKLEEKIAGYKTVDLANPVSGCSPANTKKSIQVILDHVKGTENESTFIVTEKQASPVNISSSILKYSSVTQESELPKSTQCQQENVHLNTKTVPYVLGKQDSLLLNTKIVPCVSSNQDIVNLTTVRSPEYYNPEHFVLSGAHHISSPLPAGIENILCDYSHNLSAGLTSCSYSKMSHTTPPVKEELARLTPQTSDQLTSYASKLKEWTPISFSNQKKQHFDL
ncbi:hypothetical protein Btru_015067 [Bulinus truncatus]|nr:hypothetical protein Btru_015067 [Bulinus truncatus]